MSRERERTISQIALVRATNYNPSVCLTLLTQIRVLMESSGCLDKYPHLKLYADWSVHSSLGHGGELVLQRTDAHLNEVMGNVTRYERAVSLLQETVGVYLFHREMVEFLQMSNIWPDLFFDGDLFIRFMHAVFQGLMDRPIVRSEKQQKKADANAVANSLNFVSTGISIVENAEESVKAHYQLKFVVKDLGRPSISIFNVLLPISFVI